MGKLFMILYSVHSGMKKIAHLYPLQYKVRDTTTTPCGIEKNYTKRPVS